MSVLLKQSFIYQHILIFTDQEDEDKPKISDEKKQELKAEFLTIMQQKFLQGDDKNFDYR